VSRPRHVVATLRADLIGRLALPALALSTLTLIAVAIAGG